MIAMIHVVINIVINVLRCLNQSSMFASQFR